MDIAAIHLERRLGLQRESCTPGLEDDAVRVALDGVILTSVVETRSALQPEVHASAHGRHSPDEPLSVSAGARLANRHEIHDLPYPLRCHEACDQNVRVGEV